MSKMMRLMVVEEGSFIFSFSQVLKLHAHHLAKLLEALHKLLVIAVLCHGFLGVSLELSNGLHVGWIIEYFLDLIVFFDIVEEVVGHPFLLSLLQVIVDLHGLLHLFEPQGVCVGIGVDFYWPLLLGFGGIAEEALLHSAEGFCLFIALNSDSNALDLLLQLLNFCLLFFFVFEKAKGWLCVVFGILELRLKWLLSVLDSLQVFFEVIERRHIVIRHIANNL